MSSSELADCAPTMAERSSVANAAAGQQSADVELTTVDATDTGQNKIAGRPVMLRTSDGKVLVLSSSASSGCNKETVQAGSDQPMNASSVRSKGHTSVVSTPSTSAGIVLSKNVISNDSPTSSGSSATKAAVSFSHALRGLQPTNGTPADRCPSADTVDTNKESSLPKIRFSFPSMGSRLLPKANSTATSQAQQQIGATFSPANPRFVIVKSGGVGVGVASPVSSGTTSASINKVNNNQSARPVMLSTASNDQRIFLRGVDSKSQFISSAGLKRKLNDDQRSVSVSKGLSNVYLMPNSATMSPHNHNFPPAIVTNKSNQNGKLLYISSTDAIVAFKENTMKKRQLMNNRRPCNCTKSQCLKLYCDCFANGEFCSNCHCTNCLNNLANEVDRSKAIKSCLERNPMAFQPKIGKGKADTDRLHNKGCNCKKSSCLKNYCECYEARVSCTVRCKCFGCRNTEADRSSRNRGNLTGLAGSSSSSGRLHVYSSLIGDYPPASPSSSTEDLNDRAEPKSLPKKFINDDIIDAMTRVMVATAEDLSNNGIEDDETVQIEIIKAFGSCLKKLVDTVSV